MTNLYRYLTHYEPRTCLFCGRALHLKACREMLAFIDPPFDEGPPTVLDEAPVEITNEEY